MTEIREMRARAVAMTRKEIIVRAINGKYTWIQAAQILRMSARNLRRLRKRYEKKGFEGLIDRRKGRSSPSKKIGEEDIVWICELYQKRYSGFTAKHFHDLASRDDGLGWSYTFCKNVLQDAGLIKKRKSRKNHRIKRERKSCFGQMLQMDGSEHAWFVEHPKKKNVLITVIDDATSTILYAQLHPKETSQAIYEALSDVFLNEGLPASLYTDRASWAFVTPKKGHRVKKDTLTRIGWMLHGLGVDHIPSYSPQSRGLLQARKDVRYNSN